MKQPPGYEAKRFPHHICKLDKALYGLKQAPRACHTSLSNKLQELGFIPSKADTSLFVLNYSGVTIYVLVYVDDIIIVSSYVKAIESLIKKLTSAFAIKDLSTLEFFLGVEATATKHGLLLTQKRYIHDLLARAKMKGCRAISTPMAASDKLSKPLGSTLLEDEAFQYKSIV